VFKPPITTLLTAIKYCLKISLEVSAAVAMKSLVCEM